MHHNARGEPIKLEDDLKNCYTVVPGYQLGTYTWESIPIDLHLVRATGLRLNTSMESHRDQDLVWLQERGVRLYHQWKGLDLIYIQEKTWCQ